MPEGSRNRVFQGFDMFMHNYFLIKAAIVLVCWLGQTFMYSFGGLDPGFVSIVDLRPFNFAAVFTGED
jgi:hypothetical protein